MAVNVILNLGFLAASFVPLAFIHKPTDPSKQTNIAIGVGNGGSVPHVAIWDDDGHRVGQYGGNANGHICSKDTMQITIDNKENGMKPANPAYASIVMQENDAICLATIVISGDGQQWTWTADMAYTCGAQWMESSYTFEGSNDPRRCVWIDHAHKNGIIANSLSLHMRDFTADPGLVDQYTNNTDRLCKNTKRMTFWQDMVGDSLISTFTPPLEYMTDVNQDTPSLGSTAGALKKPDLGIDRQTSLYPDGTDMNPKPKIKRGHARNFKRTAVQGVKNVMPGTLVVSHFPQHSAQDMCESPTSLGPDFVSLEENLFCDMETATLWPLCDQSHTSNCFDVNIQSLKVDGPSRRDELPVKIYTTHQEWGLPEGKRALLPEKREVDATQKKTPGSACNPPE